MKENLLKKRKKKGFTLIELIVVIAIIAIIALIAIPKVMGYQDSAKKKADIANGKTIANTVAILVTENEASVIAKENATETVFDYKSVAAITSKLQSSPTPQTKIGDSVPTTFGVSIDDKGTVKVYSGTTIDTKNMVYPTAGDNFK